MRIGLSTSVIQHGQTGISRYVLSLVASFLEHQGPHQFHLFVLEKDLPLFRFVEPQMQLVPVSERFRPPLQNILWHQARLPALARQYSLNVLHVPSYRRMLWARPCALVATIHDLAPFHVHNKYDWKRMLYGRYAARLLAQRQHQVIAISRATAGDISKFFRVPGERVKVVYNGVDHEQFFPGSAADAARHVARRFDLAQPYFLYVSRLEHPGKNHLRLLAAFDQFKARTGSPAQLILAGKDWTGAAKIHESARQSPFSQDIRFLGFVREQHLPALYRAALALVCPSLFEGFGLPLVEAMACGCPVLCSNAGSLTEVVENAALTIHPEDVTGLKNHLVALATNEPLRLRLSEAGLLQAQRFNWHQTAAATLDVYVRAMVASGQHHSLSHKFSQKQSQAVPESNLL